MKTVNKTNNDQVDVHLDATSDTSQRAVHGPAEPRPHRAATPLTHEVMCLDTAKIYEGASPNRLGSAFESEDFDRLALSILEAGGNTQAIHVRRLHADEVPSGSDYEYLLVSGARRLRACRQHGLPVLAMVSSGFVSQNELLHRLAENHNRAPLSPYEFGRQLQHILDQPGQKLSLRAVARLVGSDLAMVSKGLDIANLPSALVECFVSPADIRYADAKPLKDAYAAAPKAVLDAAAAIQAGERPKAAEVVQRLTQAAADAGAAKGPGPKRGGVESFNTRLEVDGQAVGEMAQNKAGNPVITLELALSDGQREALGRHIASFVRQRVMGLKAPKSAAKAGKRTVAASSAQAGEGASS